MYHCPHPGAQRLIDTILYDMFPSKWHTSTEKEEKKNVWKTFSVYYHYFLPDLVAQMKNYYTCTT